jgi:hypothetical protein
LISEWRSRKKLRRLKIYGREALDFCRTAATLFRPIMYRKRGESKRHDAFYDT